MSFKKPRVILGTWEIGRVESPKETCIKLLDEFFSRGYNEVDAAVMYNDTEKILGKYFTEEGVPNELVISTKADPFSYTLSKEDVLKQARTSLESLQLSCVDIFYLHAPDHNTPLEETLEAVQQLYEEGKFREFGLCNYAAWEVADVYHICKSKGYVLPTVYQGRYNAITRVVEAELFPCLRHFGLRFYAFNALAGGLLTGRYNMADMDREQEGRFWTVGGPKHAKAYRDRYWRESTFKGVELVRRALDEVYGVGKVSLVSAAFRWMNHHSKMNDNDGILIGCGKMEQLMANLDAYEEGPLEQRVVDAFDKAWEMDKSNCENYFLSNRSKSYVW